MSVDKSTSASASGPWSDGPSIPMGDPVYWQYVITNTSNGVSLTGITLKDNNGTPGNTADDFNVTCPQLTLAAGTSMTCTASGTAIAGTYSNIGTATGYPPNNVAVTANDPSSYNGTFGTLTVRKLTQDQNGNPISSVHNFQFDLRNFAGNALVVPPHTDLASNPFTRSATEGALRSR